MMYGENVPQGPAENTQNIQNASLKNQNPKAKRNRFSCSDCNFSCNSFQNYKLHMQTNHEDIEKLTTQNPSALNKPENQEMNTSEVPENQNMNTTKMPENQEMNTSNVPENQEINSSKIPENQMNTTGIPENRNMNTTRMPEKKKLNTSKVPRNRMKTTRFQGNQMNTRRIRENHEMDNRSIPGPLSEQIRKTIFFLADYIHRKDREPLIGLEYVLEYKIRTKNKIEPKYMCELCKLEADVVPMVDHLTGYRHRKLYLAKEYPYILKAPTTSKEGRFRFVRRMALEIEGHEGTKMYKKDNVVRMESMNAKTATNQSKRKISWDIDFNQSQSRMNKALEYLESFDIDNENEAMTVTELTSRLTADLKLCSEKLKEEALLPVKLAMDVVAMSVMQNAFGDGTTLQNPMMQNPMMQNPMMQNPMMQNPMMQNPMMQNPMMQNPMMQNPVMQNPVMQNPVMQNPMMQNPMMQNPMQQNPMMPNALLPNSVQQNPRQHMPPQFNRGPPEKNTMQYGLRGPNIHHIDQTKMTNASVPQKPQEFPFVPSNQIQNTQNISMPSSAGSAQFSQNDPSTENVQLMKKLMAMLKCLPQNTSSTENVQMKSQLMMLKSLLLDQTVTSDKLQQMMMQVASLAQGTGNTDKGSLNQQLMMLMSSQNSTAMNNVLLNQQMMQVASMATNKLSVENPQLNQNALMQMVGVIQDTPNTGNVPMNQNFVSNFKRGVQNQQYSQAGSSSMMQMNQDAYQKQNRNAQSEYAGAPQKSGNFGYDRSVKGNYLSQADPFTRNDGFAESGIYRANEQTRTPYSGMSYESGMHGRKWNEPSYRNPSAQVAGTAREQAPYSGVSLSPNSMAHTSNAKYKSRQFDLPDRESDILHSKRARLDMDRIPPNYREDYYRQPRGVNPAYLSADVRDRIRGRDEFTVSAILSEYADNRPSK